MKIDPIHATIMIIDDEPENLNVLGEMLRHEGWMVQAFPRGDLALAAAREESPDLVLLDIRMSDMDGYEVCRRFKTDENLRSIPVIFLSGFSEPAEKVRAFEAGGVDYITKPFSEIEVLARTRTHLKLRRHELHLEELLLQRGKELSESHRRLLIWDNAKDQWLSMLAHEMRTPLAGAFGIAELAFKALPPDSDLNPMRATFDHARARIEKLVNDALTLLEIDVASENFTVSPVPLMPVLKNALAAVTSQIPDISLSAFISAIETVSVLGKTKLLDQAFTDLLLTAACCVLPRESITLQTRVSGGQIKVTIITSGQALPIKAIDTFFDVGGQRTLLKGGGDYGMGPALASRIIRLFNGRISIRNGPEHGIIIEVSLPVE